MDKLRSVRGPTISLLIVGCFCLLLLVVLNLVFGSRAQDASETVNTSRDVRAHAVSLRSALQTAEASQRGYLLTRNEIYLAPFATALDEAERALSALRERDGLLPTGENAFQKLETVIQEKIVELETTVDQYRRGERDEALEAVSQNGGKALMDEANVFISAIVRKAERDLTASVALQQDSLRTVQISTYIAVVAVFLVTAGVYFIQRSFVRELRTANEQVQSLNAELEARVEERTHQLKQARDRAEVLLAEVNHRVANSLTMVASMVGMQARASGDQETKRILADTQARINAVSVVHKQLYTSSNVQSVALPDFLPKLLEQIEGAMRSEGLSATVRKEFEAIEMPTDQAISLGIILTEWVTNAFKYAYPASIGEIRVKLVHKGDGLAQISVEDDGVGFVPSTVPKGTGLGSKLVSAMAASLGGTVEYLNRNPGTEARMVLPL
jgi:two-component sensor histidine kinase/CHASE3 domain sensor protein